MDSHHGPQHDSAIIDCALYVDGERQPDDVSVPCALEIARRRGGFVWVGLHEPSDADFAELAKFFALPELAVEDAVRAHQRPKLERYGDVTFMVIKPVRYIDSDEIVDVSEIALFIGEHFVVSVRHGSSTVPAQAREQLENDPSMLRFGPSAVLHRIADVTVDEYADVIEAMGDDIDEIEEQVFSGESKNRSQRIYKLKREVLEFHRAVAPLTTVMSRVAEPDDVSCISADVQPYFRDVHDHVLRAADAIGGYDRLLTDVLQADLAQITVQQNADMRRISAWAAIALLPTAVAGIYGMNFENMPELRTRYGYFVVLAVIAGLCTGLYAFFRKNRWL